VIRAQKKEACEPSGKAAVSQNLNVASRMLKCPQAHLAIDDIMLPETFSEPLVSNSHPGIGS
jgi:hypothetical protein